MTKFENHAHVFKGKPLHCETCGLSARSVAARAASPPKGESDVRPSVCNNCGLRHKGTCNLGVSFVGVPKAGEQKCPGCDGNGQDSHLHVCDQCDGAGVIPAPVESECPVPCGWTGKCICDPPCTPAPVETTPAISGLQPKPGHAEGCGAHDDYHCDCTPAPVESGVMESDRPYGPKWATFAAPGDAQDDFWLLRFADRDCGEQQWSGPDAEREAWEAYNRFAPAYNIWLLRLAKLDDAALATPKEVEALGGGCVANGGGLHSCMGKGAQAFCPDCGLMLKRVAYVLPHVKPGEVRAAFDATPKEVTEAMIERVAKALAEHSRPDDVTESTWWHIRGSDFTEQARVAMCAAQVGG